jgi:acyl-homoserine-lactone acylase
MFMVMRHLGWLFFLCVAAHAESRTATIYRDTWGVPHIVAEREEDGFFAVGYAQAQDRLPQMLRAYLAVQGQQAAVFGAQWLEQDFANLSALHLEQSRQAFYKLTPQLQLNYRSFMAGVARYMQDQPSQVPAWWRTNLDPALIIAVERAERWQPYMGIDHALAKCVRSGLPPQEQLAHFARRAKVVGASNVWTVSPWRTVAGKAFLLSDPHGDFGKRWEFTLHAGQFRSAGHVDIGMTLPFMANSQFIAWGQTTGSPDVADCYRVTMNPDSMSQFKYDGKLQQLQRRRFAVKVKGGNTETRDFYYSRHNGVSSLLVGRRGDQAFFISTPYMADAGAWDEQVYRQHLARNVDDFIKALEIRGFHAENIMAADTAGNTYYVRFGRVPRRAVGLDVTRALDGNRSATAWQGLHEVSELVQIKNPSTGFMQNNNVLPEFMTGSAALLQRANYPGYIYGILESWEDDGPWGWSRGERANELLGSIVYGTLTDMEKVAFDVTWVGVADWQRALRLSIAAHPQVLVAPQSLAVAQRLLSFDGVASATATDAALFKAWIEAIAPPAPQTMDDLYRKVRTQVPLADAEQRSLLQPLLTLVAPRSPLGEKFRIVAAKETLPVAGVTLDFGENGVSPLHIAYFSDPDANGIQLAEGGSKSMRLIELSSTPKVFSAVMYGQSEWPNSIHFDDQARLFAARKFKQVPFDLAQIRREAVHQMTLTLD